MLIWDKGKFLICHRPSNKTRALLCESVGDKVEKGETKEHAFIRECREGLITVVIGNEFISITQEYPNSTIHLPLFNSTVNSQGG